MFKSAIPIRRLIVVLMIIAFVAVVAGCTPMPPKPEDHYLIPEQAPRCESGRVAVQDKRYGKPYNWVCRDWSSRRMGM